MRIIILCLLIASIPAFGQTLLIGQGTNWKYFDQGNIGTSSWNTLGFDDFGWSSGNAELGYGDGDEATTVNYGPDGNNKYSTTYFRQEFLITNPAQFTHLNLNLLRDDGAVVYINGAEVWRSNMPSGTIGYSTWADGTIAWPSEDDWHSATASAGLLQNGMNVVAVEVHQDEGSSSDISFNFSMTGESGLTASITRGPYLQKVNQNSIIVRWQTNVATDSRVDVGFTPVILDQMTINPVFTTDHEVQVTGLNAETNYYYAIGHFGAQLASGNNHYFETMPPSGKEDAYEFIVLGDCGTGYQEQLDVKNAMIGHYGQHFDGVILLGDNAYQGGFDSEYQSNFFGKYDEIFENTVIWPAPGNHDYNNHIPFSPDPAYYDIFNTPANGECGGLASGTEKYYSFNYGNIHFISLDSYDEDRSASAPMATWLTNDLASNTLPWIVAFWHHPPYTKGSHDSDNDNFLDGELVEIREEIIPILESYGVDLILNGHSHSYERSYLIDSHYGYSNTFGAVHVKDGSSGDYPTSCPYHKNTTGGDGHQGTVYCVMGNSGKTSSVDSEWPHPAMYSYTADEVGAIMLSINGNRLDADFYTSSNQLFDHYTIVKTEGNTFDMDVCIMDDVTLSPSWPVDGLSIWNPGNFYSADYNFQAISNTQIIRDDSNSCIADTFNIVVLQNDTCGYLATNQLNVEQKAFHAYFNKDELNIKQDQIKIQNFILYDIKGQLVAEIEVLSANETKVFSNLKPGTYILKSNKFNQSQTLIKYE